MLEGLAAVVAAINAVILHYQVPPGTGGTVVARRPARCWEITVGMRGISYASFCEKCSSGVPNDDRRRFALGGVRGGLRNFFTCLSSQTLASGILFPYPNQAIEVLTVKEQLPQLAIVRERNSDPREHARGLKISHAPGTHA